VTRHLPVLANQNQNNLVRLAKPINASMSKTDLLLQCQYWASPTVFTVPESEDPSKLNEALRFGRAFHKCMEIHLAYYGKKKPNFKVIANTYSIDPKRLENFYRRAKEWIDKQIKKNGWETHERLVEKKLAYDPFLDTTRFLESTGERDYSNRKQTEFPGTGDLAIPFTTQPMIVLDWKSGQSTYEAKDNGQLLSLTLGLSRIVKNYEAKVFIARIDEEWIDPSESFLTQKHLNTHREMLADALSSALSKNPSMRPGSHCFKYYCPASDVCPAHAGPLSLRDMIEGVLTEEQRGHQYARYVTAKKLIEKIGDFWHRDIPMNGPVILDNGDLVVLKDVHEETISKASIRRALDPVEAKNMIDRLDSIGAVESSDYKRLSVVRDPSSKK
jgi:PD-(D/E)XK nuclease superfamily